MMTEILALSELNRKIFKIYSGVPARRFVQDLDVGQLERFLRCLNAKYARHLKNSTNVSHSRKTSMFVFHKPILAKFFNWSKK